MKNKGYIVAVIIFLTFILGPILWCFIISIGQESDLFSQKNIFLPKELYFGNYKALLSFETQESLNFLLALKNSIFTAILSVIIGLPLAIFTGYAFARSRRKSIDIFRKILLMTMIIPAFTTLIPLYTIFSKYNLLNNLFWLSLIYTSSFLPIISWITMNYFKEFPIEIEEMALIDGCSYFRLLIYIVIPNIYPILITGALIIFLKSWSQYQIPLILASNRTVKPLTMLIGEFSSKDMIMYGQMAAAGILSLLPPLILAIFFRRYLISGLTKGATK